MRDFVPAARVIVTNCHHTVWLFQCRTSIDHNQPHQTTTAMMTQKRTIKKQGHQTTAPSRQCRAIDCSSFPLHTLQNLIFWPAHWCGGWGLCVGTNHVSQQQPLLWLWWGRHALFAPSPSASLSTPAQSWSSSCSSKKYLGMSQN